MSSKDDAFLEEARLGPRTRVLIECEEIPNLSRLKRRFREYVLTDLAHAVMLVETGILAPDRGAMLLEGLMDMHDSAGADFPWLAESGSFLVQTEHWLAQRMGEDIAGRLQTGRSRNDQSAAAERLYVRDLLLEVAAGTVRLQRHVLAQAEAHAGTLMPGYTHLQHAQPTTFGHHMMRFAAAFDRDLERLRDAWPRINLSSLGGAAMAGTSWPVDRARTARAARPRRHRRQLLGRRRLRARLHRGGGGRSLDPDVQPRTPRRRPLRLALVGVRLRRGRGRSGRHVQHHAPEEEPALAGAGEGAGRAGGGLACGRHGMPGTASSPPTWT